MSKLPFPRSILAQHMAYLGKTGSGKSSAMRVVAEDLLTNKKRTCIVDPKGDWYGLKSSADGKSAGFPVIAFGDFKEPQATDIPINPQSGKHVAELIATGNRPCIIGFRGWMPGQMTKFWIDFASTLFNANEGELYVFIDEVHNFAPKGKIMDPDSGKCLHWTNRILSEGRGLGLTFYVASQRPQKVHNDTLDCCETLVAMRVAHPKARLALKEWIDGNGDKEHGQEVLNTLAQMARGEAWVWSPENHFGPTRVKFPMFSTFDSFAPPQLQKKISQSGWSEVDLDAVKEKLAVVIEEAKANDPRELKRQIAELRKQQSAQPTTQPGKVVEREKIVKVADLDAIRSALATRDDEWIRAVGDFQIKLKGIIEKVSFTPPGRAKIDPTLLKPSPSTTTVHVKYETPSERLSLSIPRAKVSVETHGDLTGPEQNILNQLAELEALGIRQPDRAQLGLMAGYTNFRSGGFSEPLKALFEKGCVAYPSQGKVSITPHGHRLSQPGDSPLSSAELHDRLCTKLGAVEGRILREVIACYPDQINKDDLGHKLGYTNPRSGGFSEPVGRLRDLGIVVYPERGAVKASDWLFITGGSK